MLTSTPWLFLAAALLAGCGRAAVDTGQRSTAPDPLVARFGCTNCHATSADRRARLAPVAAPDLSRVARRLTLPGIANQILGPRVGLDGSYGCASNVSAAEAFALASWLTEGDDFVDVESVEVLPHEIEAGRVLFDSIGCRACHDGGGSKGGLDVEEFAGDYSILSLALVLAAPAAHWPEGGHPDFGLTKDEARRLATFVLAGDRVVFGREPGLRFEYYEADDFAGGEPDWDAMQAAATGLATAIDLEHAEREDQFGLRLTGTVRLPADGTYTFFLTSDDGSTLDLDGVRLIDHGGLHGDWTKEGTVELSAGFHPIVVTMFERTGGEVLQLEFEAPGIERRTFDSSELYFDSAMYEPPAVFPDRRLGAVAALRAEDVAVEAGAGATLFRERGCVNCHSGPGVPRERAAHAKPLAELRPGHGCLPGTASELAPELPRFGFLDPQRPAAEEERAALTAYLAATDPPSGPLAPAELLARELPRLGCLACHERDGTGGPSQAARPFFAQSYDGDDLGDEGRFPPSLTGIGAKLNEAWLAKVIAEGSHGGRGVRPYMRTQMPAFPRELAARLAAAFAAADAPPSAQAAPAFSEAAMETGRTLVGTGGFACIVCHEVAGKPSLGIPMIELATTPERLRYDWFVRWVEDPTALRPGTRMAGYWPGGKSARTDILNGEASAQIAAIWTYLSLGTSLPLPDGLNLDPAAFDLEPGLRSARPIYHACFLRDASARGLAVGFPERKHLAFDADNLRITALWYGAFVNAADTWDGRAGGLVVPAGDGVLRLPAGLAIAELASPDAPWPTNDRRELGWSYLGHRRDSTGIPTFRYAKGAVTVEETLRPELGPGGRFIRRFHVTGIEPGRWYLRLGEATAISSAGNRWTLSGTGLVDGEPAAEVHITVAGATTRRQPSSATSELLVELTPDATGSASVELHIEW